MRRSRIALAIVVLGILAGCAAQPSTLVRAQRYPVPASFGESLFTAIRDLYGPPAGANLWDCRPTDRHPRPVILLHGIAGNMADNMSGISPFLANEGYCVYALNYGGDPQSIFGGVQDIRLSAIDQFGPFVERVLASTGARQVDVVGHSEGSVMPRYWMRFGNSVHPDGTAKVNTLVGVAPASNGAGLAGYAEAMQRTEPFAGLIRELGTNGCGACPQLMRGSDFFRVLNTAEPQPGERFSGPAQPGVRYLMLATSWDNFVVPYRDGFIDHPQFVNTRLQDVCPINHADHLAIIFDPTTLDLIADMLDPAAPRAVRCVATSPVFPADAQD